MSSWSQSKTNSRTDHYTQIYTPFPNPSCWCSYMTLIYTPYHSTPPPSNSVHTHSQNTTPEENHQICLDDRGMAGLYECILSLCSLQQVPGFYSLYLDPKWADGNLMKIKHTICIHQVINDNHQNKILSIEVFAYVWKALVLLDILWKPLHCYQHNFL